MLSPESQLKPADIKQLAEYPAYPKLIAEFEDRLESCRRAADEISPEKLLELQGRIQTWKEIINLFNVEVYDGRE